MRVRCYLREIRGERSLRSVAEEAGVSPAILSTLERGEGFVHDSDIEKLVAAYGASVADWYPPTVLLAVESDDSKLMDIRRRLRTTLLREEA
jgi:transcriptional regulator with XRE-family HTH domain